MALPTTIETMLTAVNNLLGTIDGKLRNKASKTELADGLALKANKSETLTPAEIEARIQSLIGSAPEALDTLVELANALNNDPDFASTVTTALAAKATKDELENALAQLTDAFTQGAATISAATPE
jgi:predicted component of type VI protein secretion system